MFSAEIGFIKWLLSSYSISSLTTQVGTILYGQNARIGFELNKYGSKSSLRTAMDGLRNPSDGNNIVEALQLARTTLFSQENGARYDTHKSLVIFLNERRIGNDKELDAELQLLKSAGIRIVVVAIGDKVDKKLATRIASPNSVIFAPGLEEINHYLYTVYIATLPG